MADVQFQLVFQLPGNTQEDFDLVVRLEDSLMAALDGTSHEVDGHDFGSGTGNVFIHTNDPVGAFDLARKAINLTEHPRLRAAYSLLEEEDYTLIWPEDSSEEFNLIKQVGLVLEMASAPVSGGSVGAERDSINLTLLSFLNDSSQQPSSG